MKKDLNNSLYKKAVGYTVKEVTEEYGGEGGDLLKRKVSKKHIPPDITAIKTYIELNKDNNDLANYSDEQLEQIKQRLISELLDKEKNENSKPKN